MVYCHACTGGGEAWGGAEAGVGWAVAPWKMGHPVAGGTGCRGWLMAGAWWVGSRVGGDVLEEVALWEGIVVVLDVVLCGWELGSQNVDLVVECG